MTHIKPGERVTVEVTDRWATRPGTITLRAGVIDNDARMTYREGQCHALALALSALTGWPIYFAGSAVCYADGDEPACGTIVWPGMYGYFEPRSELCDCQVSHLLVRMPDGRFLDIDGPRTLEELQQDDNEYDGAWPAPDSLLSAAREGEAGWVTPNLELASVFARAILQSIWPLLADGSQLPSDPGPAPNGLR